MRVALERLLEVLEESPGIPVLLQAPTGYGKTSLTPSILRRLRDSGGTYSLVHSLPLRAIVEDAYVKFSEELRSEAQVGYQAHGLNLLGKAPFMASDVVVTTLDSLLLNLVGANVAEKSLGHYHVPRAFIYTSTVVFDEAHLPLKSDDKALYEALGSAVWILAYSGNPVIIESATLPGRVVGWLASLLGSPGPGVRLLEPVPLRGTRECQEYYEGLGLFRGGAVVECIEDEGYYEAVASVKWLYEPLHNRAEDKVVEYYSLGLTVFRAINTVREAIREYKKLVKRFGSSRVALIHGRMTPRDRREHLERIKRALETRKGILVGTSAVEAGVDLDFDALVTDATSMDSLLQRMGRVNRGNLRPEAHVTIVGEDAIKLASKLSRVNPRLPYDYRGSRGYRGILDELTAVDLNRNMKVHSVVSRLIASLADPVLQERMLENLASVACGLVREEPLVTVIPHPDDLEDMTMDELAAKLDEYAFPINLGLLRRARILEEPEPGYVVALVADPKEHRGHPDRIEWILRKIRAPHGIKCKDYLKLLSRENIVALVLSRGSYEQGVGLWIPEKR